MRLHVYSRHQKKLPGSVPFFVTFRSVPFTSVLTVCRGQTVLALGMNSSAKFTACVGEALRDYFQRLDQEVGFSYHEKGYRPRSIALFIAGVHCASLYNNDCHCSVQQHDSGHLVL